MYRKKTLYFFSYSLAALPFFLLSPWQLVFTMGIHH